MTVKKLNKTFLYLLLMVLLLQVFSLVALADEFVRPTPAPAQTPEPFLSYPETDSEGFLKEALSKEAPAFIHADKELGRWIYISTDLRVEIERRVMKQRAGKVYYYISDIRFKNDQIFRAYSNVPEKPDSSKIEKPEKIAKKHKIVYAQNGDLFTWRIHKKQTPGLIIRNGKIIRQKTFKKVMNGNVPLDELSLYTDGRIEMHYPGELTAEQYLEKGALDVFAFGPILIKNNVIDDRMYGKHYRHLEPRSAIGVVKERHFKGILVEGRNKRSTGEALKFVAERLLEEGCTDAFTLDGGQTAAMIFMGDIVMAPGTYSGFTKTRRQPDIIGIGVSNQKLPQTEKKK